MKDQELISKTLVKKPFIIYKRSLTEAGLEYSICKREICTNFELKRFGTSFKLFGKIKEVVYEILKAGVLSGCLQEYTKIINKSVTTITAERTYLNTKAIYCVPYPHSHLLKKNREEFYDLYSQTIELDCDCDKCRPKSTKQVKLTKYLRLD